MYRVLTKPVWFVLTVAVLVAGAAALAVAQQRESAARDDLVMLGIANYNLALVVQARIDVALGQESLAITDASDAALEQHVEFMRSHTDRVDQELLDLRQRLSELESGETRGGLVSLSIMLSNIEIATMKPVRGQQQDAAVLTWWALALTASTLAALLVVEIRRPAR